MKKFFLFLSGFFIGLIIFLPKDNIYYTIQKYLAKEHIYINSQIKNGLILKLTNGKIFKNDIDILSFKTAEIKIFLLYNNIDIKNIKINFNKYKIDNLNLTYSFINPLKIYIKGKANFGEIKGEIDIYNHFIKIYLLKLKDINLKQFLKHDKKGYFYYVQF